MSDINNNVNILKSNIAFKNPVLYFYQRYLYAVGGQDGVSCLNIVERYDSKANSWSRVTPMSCRRLGKSIIHMKNLHPLTFLYTLFFIFIMSLVVLIIASLTCLEFSW